MIGKRTPTEDERKAVIRSAMHLVAQLQEQTDPPEALALLSLALQMTLLLSMDTKQDAFSAIDHITGELRAAVMNNVEKPVTRKANGHG